MPMRWCVRRWDGTPGCSWESSFFSPVESEGVSFEDSPLGGKEVSSQYAEKNSRFLKNSYAFPNLTADSPVGGGMRRMLRNAAVLSNKSSF